MNIDNLPRPKEITRSKISTNSQETKNKVPYHENGGSTNSKQNPSTIEFSNYRNILNENPDQQRVFQTIENVGMTAFGVMAVDVWRIDDVGRMMHVEGGTWINPRFKPNCKDIQRLYDPTHPMYVRPIPQVPGVGLAGHFWSLALNDGRSRNARNDVERIRANPTLSLRDKIAQPFFRGNHSTEGDLVVPCNPEIQANKSSTSHHLVWINLHDLTSDPLQPPYPRMNLLEEIGLQKCTGVPYDVLGKKGVVLYFARGTASERLLTKRDNDDFLRMATMSIGSAAALSNPRQRIIAYKSKRSRRLFRRAYVKITCVLAFLSSRNISYEKLTIAPALQESYERVKNVQMNGWCCRKVCSASTTFQQIRCLPIDLLKKIVRKSKGGASNPPPGLPFKVAIWGFVGSCITLMTVSGMLTVVSYYTGVMYHSIFGPLAALMTLQYALTPAPASQPRNIIYGQIISLVIATFYKYTLYYKMQLDEWLIVSLTVATSISAMMKIGCIHPPAAASVCVYLLQPSHQSDWIYIALMISGNVLAIFTAIIFCNVNEKKQYPVFWNWELRLFSTSQ